MGAQGLLGPALWVVSKGAENKRPPEGGLSLLSALDEFWTAQDLASINPPDRTWQGFCKSISARYGDAIPDRTQAGR